MGGSDNSASDSEFDGVLADVVADVLAEVPTKIGASSLSSDPMPLAQPSAAEDTLLEAETDELLHVLEASAAAAVSAALAYDEVDPEKETGGEDTTNESVPESTVSHMGYVTCSVEPWACHGGYVDRVTAWPSTVLLCDRNVATKCYMHPKCSVPRRRARLTDKQLLAWLYAATPLDSNASSAAKLAARNAHFAMAKDLLPAGRGLVHAPSGAVVSAS